MQTRLYTQAVNEINAHLPAAQAKKRRRPACTPERADLYRELQIRIDAANAAAAALTGDAADFARGLAAGYDTARRALRKTGRILGLCMQAGEIHRRATKDLTDYWAYAAGHSAAMAEMLPRLAPVGSWIEQGYNARLMDLPRPVQWTDEGDAWRIGWDLAEYLIQINADEADAKSGLDPLPLPAWADLMEVYA